jgi:hypothetical protein
MAFRLYAQALEVIAYSISCVLGNSPYSYSGRFGRYSYKFHFPNGGLMDENTISRKVKMGLFGENPNPCCPSFGYCFWRLVSRKKLERSRNDQGRTRGRGKRTCQVGRKQKPSSAALL